MIGSYQGTSVCIDRMGALNISQGGSSYTLSKLKVENCGSAINIGSIPAIGGFNKLNLSIKLINYSKEILNLNSNVCGWKLGRNIINKNYQVVGIVNESKVYSLSNEYIGNFEDNYIMYHDSCYESGEPIYISRQNRFFKMLNLFNEYDLSLRLLNEDV